MSRRDAFVTPRAARWARLELLLRARSLDADGVAELSRLVRATAADLATAQTADLPEDVLAYLDDLAGRAHNALYGTRRLDGLNPARVVLFDFPRELRANAGFFLAACVLFGLPFVVASVSAWADPSVAARVLPEGMLQQAAAMYAQEIGRGGVDQDASMAGFYVNNNVGIAFQTFAGGAFAGLGAIYLLVFNGAVIGTTIGYVASTEGAFNLLVFISGHAAWELIGIAVAGAAGLRLGWAMLVTGGRSRVASMRAAGPVLFRLTAGFLTMLLVAAAIEGFWSASPVPWWVKLPFGLVQLAVILLWFAFGGRR